MNRQCRKTRSALLPIMVAAALLAGCGETKTSVTNRVVSPEQESRDLQRALDAGAISPAEFQQQQRKLSR
jgi:hypothetical protein